MRKVSVGNGPKEVGAPASGIEVAPGANALTPRDKDLTPVFGPGIHPHGDPYPIPNRAACRGGATRPDSARAPLRSFQATSDSIP
jgi:hypothetical protein